MHYYQFNIGDYASHTSRLSLMEDLAYRRLLDLYYLNEQPFNECLTDVAREIGMPEHKDEITYILNIGLGNSNFIAFLILNFINFSNSFRYISSKTLSI